MYDESRTHPPDEQGRNTRNGSDGPLPSTSSSLAHADTAPRAERRDNSMPHNLHSDRSTTVPDASLHSSNTGADRHSGPSSALHSPKSNQPLSSSTTRTPHIEPPRQTIVVSSSRGKEVSNSRSTEQERSETNLLAAEPTEVDASSKPNTSKLGPTPSTPSGPRPLQPPPPPHTPQSQRTPGPPNQLQNPSTPTPATLTTPISLHTIQGELISRTSGSSSDATLSVHGAAFSAGSRRPVYRHQAHLDPDPTPTPNPNPTPKPSPPPKAEGWFSRVKKAGKKLVGL